MSADIVILTGPPGAGKSTTARSLASTYGRSVHLHTDDFWRYIVAGAIPPYLPESADQNELVMQVIQRAAATYADGGYVTVIDGVIGPWMLGHFRHGNESADNARLHYVVLRPSRDETLRRAQRRTTGDALVDEAPIDSLWRQFSDLGQLERHVIDTTHQEPAETLVAVQDAVASNSFVLEVASP